MNIRSQIWKCKSSDIKNYAWVIVNNDFWVTSEAICQRFCQKSLANRITSDPKIIIHGNECIILFLTRCVMSWTHNSAKNNHRSLISQLLGTVVSDLALWRHHSGSVTSREREIQALWRHIRRLFSHAQIGAKAIFCEWATTVNIDCSSPGIHGLACKKVISWLWHFKTHCGLVTPYGDKELDQYRLG